MWPSPYLGPLKVNYLGYTINGDGIKPGKGKLKAVRKFQMPDSLKKIREFVGLANYFKFLIPHFSANATQLTKLTKLTKTSSGYKEGEIPLIAQQAFVYLRNKLCEEPLVAHPKPGLPYHLATDAAAGDEGNPGGLGPFSLKYGRMGTSGLFPMPAEL